jgi:uncharacterized protein (TIGR02246 family)
MHDQSLEARIAAVEDRLAIQQLVARYAFAIDDRDLAAVGELFADDARFRSLDGAMDAVGREAIVEQFERRYSVLGPTNHFTHDHAIELDGPARARGRVSLHAELWRNERAMLTALRYADVYEKAGGVWRFSERTLSFFYYLPVEDYAAMLGRLDRNRAYAEPRPADWPERLPTWVEYRPNASAA